MIKLISILKEVILEARSKTLTRTVRDELIAKDNRLTPSPKVNRVYAPGVSEEDFKGIIKSVYPEIDINDIKVVGAKKFEEGAQSSQFPTFIFRVDNQDVSIVLAKGEQRGSKIESSEVASVQQQIDELGEGEGITIKVAGKTYEGITKIEKVGGNKKADFQLSNSGGPAVFVQHKSPKAQQMAGIARPPYSEFGEVKSFVEDVRDSTNDEGEITKPIAKEIVDESLKRLAVYGTLDASFSVDAVQVYCVGNIKLVGNSDGAYTIQGATDTFTYPEIPTGDNEPVLGATYRLGRNQAGIKNVRMGIYPKSFFTRKS
jgi:hypothetical protein